MVYFSYSSGKEVKMDTKKSLMIIFVLTILIAISVFFNNYKEIPYLNQNILDSIMYDYNFLTGNSIEETQKYFEDLENNTSNYSIDTLKSLGVYGENSEDIVLRIQANYLKLTNEISKKEKEDLDKYLLENSLKYYYEKDRQI